jgi:hemolysin III
MTRIEQLQTDLREELANVLTHGAGAVASLVGGTVLIVLAAVYGDGWKVASSAVFAATLVLLYTASTLYHAARTPVARARLKVFDHCAIYLLIAGTYTPFTLLGLRGGWGWSLFGIAWGLAVAGVMFKLFFTGRFPRVSTAHVPGDGVDGGRRHRAHGCSGWTRRCWRGSWPAGWPTPRGPCSTTASRPYAHAVWHLFVLAGSACHFVAVTRQVLHG